MPRQNRVTPLGEIVAVPERGTLMGNRGVLHDEQGRIRRAWQVKRWLLCVLEFKERKRVVMTPGRYTELFFLDEASGLAAGHRRCAECRRSRYVAYRDAWSAGNRELARGGPVTADLLDTHLHAERSGPDRSKRLFRANLDELPDGVFIVRNGHRDGVSLLWQGHLFAWSPQGYQRGAVRPRAEVVQVVTPRSTVAAIRAGYVPEVHPSAGLA
jgi:hypothetical protein